MEPQEKIEGNPPQAVSTESAPVSEEIKQAAPEVTDAAVVEKPAISEEQTVSETTGEEEGSEPAEQPKVVKELISTRKRAQLAEQEAEYWKNVADGRIKLQPEPEAKPTTVQQPVKPDLNNFEKYEDYESALQRYTIDIAKHEVRQELELETTQKTEAEINRSFIKRIEAASKEDPDLLKVFAAKHSSDPYFIPSSDAMLMAVRDSEIAPQIVRYLLDNKAEAARIASLNPYASAKEMGKIEAMLIKPTAPPPKKKVVSQAPEPIKSIQTSGTVVIPEEELPTEEFMKRRNERQYGRR
jgi:hypothetical protein